MDRFAALIFIIMPPEGISRHLQAYGRRCTGRLAALKRFPASIAHEYIAVKKKIRRSAAVGLQGESQ
jgi:hypothetical protein